MAEKIDYQWYRNNLDKWFFNLDVAVMRALDLFTEKKVQDVPLFRFQTPLVVGSGNAYETGRILFNGRTPVFANESDYEGLLEDNKNIDGAVLISASGEKDAPRIGQELQDRGLERILLTCNPGASAIEYFKDKKGEFYEFPSNPELQTYNTSTYMGMILAKTNENTGDVGSFIPEEVERAIPRNLRDYSSFVLLFDNKFSLITRMLDTKFDELFARRLSSGVFSKAYAEGHAVDVVPTEKELFVSFGYKNEKLGEEKNRITIPLPENADYAAAMAVGYFFMEKLQGQREPYFKSNVVDWCENRGRSPLVTFPKIEAK